MKHLILSFCLTVFCLYSQAQKINFCDTSNVWHVLQRVEVASQGHIFIHKNYRYFYSGAIKIDTQNYNQLEYYNSYSNQYLLVGFVRYDSISEKVYIKSKANAPEEILYDYTLNVGDTITRPPMFRNTDEIRHVVTKIDSITINNIPYRQFEFSVVDPLQRSSFIFDYTVIEGIGCLTHPMLPLRGYLFLSTGEYEPSVICFKNNSMVPSIFKNCKDSVLNIEHTKATAYNSISVYPQPASGEINIELPLELPHGILYIINTMGQVISEQSFKQTSTLKYSNTNLHGLYYYKIVDINKSYQYSGRLLFE